MASTSDRQVVSALPLVTQPQGALFWDDPNRDSYNWHRLSRPRYAVPRYAHTVHISVGEGEVFSYLYVSTISKFFFTVV